MNKEAASTKGAFDLVGHVKVSLVAEIGKAEMTIDELFSLKGGDTIKLSNQSDLLVTILLNGRPIARGELVSVEDAIGVRVTELSLA